MYGVVCFLQYSFDVRWFGHFAGVFSWTYCCVFILQESYASLCAAALRSDKLTCNLLLRLRRASPTSRATLEPRDASATRYPDIAVEDDAILYHVDVSIVPMSANITATTEGAAAASKDEAKIATYLGTAWANAIPFVLEFTGHLS